MAPKPRTESSAAREGLDFTRKFVAALIALVVPLAFATSAITQDGKNESTGGSTEEYIEYTENDAKFLKYLLDLQRTFLEVIELDDRSTRILCLDVIGSENQMKLGENAAKAREKLKWTMREIGKAMDNLPNPPKPK